VKISANRTNLAEYAEDGQSPDEEEKRLTEYRVLGTHAGLAKYTGWTIITEKRFSNAGFPLDFGKFNCHAWADGKVDEKVSIPRIEDAKNVYGRYGYTEYDYPIPQAEIVLMGRGPLAEHSYRNVGPEHYTSKMGEKKNEPVIIHTLSQIDPPPENSRDKLNFYGDSVRWYKK